MCSRRPALDSILKGAKNKKESESLSAACYDMESMDTGYNGYNMYMIREMTNNIRLIINRYRKCSNDQIHVEYSDLSSDFQSL